MKVVISFLAVVLVLLAGCAQGQQGAVRPGDLQIVTKSLPNWESGGRATYKIEVAGGVPPYTFSIEGSLPQGFTLGPDGTIGGGGSLQPGTSKQTFPPFIVGVTDSRGKSVKASFAISIIEVNTLQLLTNEVTCTVKEDCNEQLATAAGGNPPYSFQSDTFREGAPPMGTIIDINGVLKGVPSREGEYVVGVCVKDTIGYSRCGKAKVIIEKEKEAELAGVWVGTYSETETTPPFEAYGYSNPGCVFRNAGTMTATVSVSGDSFTGTIDDRGTSQVLSGDCETGGGGGYSFRLSLAGTVSGDELRGTISGGTDTVFNLPFTAKISDDTMTGKYTGTGVWESGTNTYSGTFNLKKQS